MIKFKVGYYYKYTGNPFPSDEATQWKNDGKWRKCVEVDKYGDAYFEGIEGNWNISGFIESKYSPRLKVKKLLEET